MRAERAGRTAFGLVMIAGAAVLTWQGVDLHKPYPRVHAWEILTGAWVGAFVAYLIVTAAARRIAIRRSLRVPGLVVPTIGIALLVPLTLHMPVALMIGGIEGFDVWCCVCITLIGITNLLFAAFAAMRAYRLVTDHAAQSPWKIYNLTVFIACVPFVLLFALPPLVVAATGLPIVPMLYGMEKIAAADRVPELAFAIARRPRHAAA